MENSEISENPRILPEIPRVSAQNIQIIPKLKILHLGNLGISSRKIPIIWVSSLKIVPPRQVYPLTRVFAGNRLAGRHDRKWAEHPLSRIKDGTAGGKRVFNPLPSGERLLASFLSFLLFFSQCKRCFLGQFPKTSKGGSPVTPPSTITGVT